MDRRFLGVRSYSCLAALEREEIEPADLQSVQSKAQQKSEAAQNAEALLCGRRALALRRP